MTFFGWPSPKFPRKRSREEMSEFKRDDSIKLGDEAIDRITGCTGIVIAITDWINGCRRLTLQPKALHEGRPVEPVTFDAEQIALVAGALPRVIPPTGGPSIAPVRNRDPR